MPTVPVATGEPPEKPSHDPVTPHPESGEILPPGAAEYVSLDELLDVAAEPPAQPSDAALVLQPPCRSHARTGWDLANRVTSGDWKHTWQAAVLLVVLGVVTSGILLAGSVALRAAALSALGLYMLLRLSKRNASPVQQA